MKIRRRKLKQAHPDLLRQRVQDLYSEVLVEKKRFEEAIASHRKLDDLQNVIYTQGSHFTATISAGKLREILENTK